MFYFLQLTPIEARQAPSPLIYIGFILAAVGILFFFALNKALQKKVFDLLRKSASRKEVNAVADSLGLDKNEKKFLASLCKRYQIKNLAFCFKNDKAVDSLFKQIFHLMTENKNPAEEIEGLFKLRQKIEQYRRKSTILGSSQNIPINQEILIISPQKDQYVSMVLENTPKGLVVTTPRDSMKNEVLFKTLTKLGVFFHSKNYTDYIFTTRVLQYSSSQNVNKMILVHSNNLIVLQSREFRRKKISLSCSLTYAIPQIGDDVNKVAYKLSGSPFSAVVSDVSAGGCCIKTSKHVSDEQYLQISIEKDLFVNEEIIGQIMRSQEQNNEILFHVKFVAMSKQVRNGIFSLVYDYN